MWPANSVPVLNKGLLLLVVLFTFGVAPVTAQQCTQKIVDLPAVPELYGFRLGMSKEDVKAHVPQTTFAHADDFGVSKTTINPYFDPKIDKTKFVSVRSVSLDFLDDRLTSLWIGFDETYKAQTVDEFVKGISQALRLPDSWSPWKGRGQHLRCGDFEAFVTTVAGSPSLRLLDIGAEDTIAARRLAREEKDSKAEETAAEGTKEPEIIGDKRDKTYYPIGCTPAKEIGEPNTVVFKTTAEAEKMGFKPAKVCH
jgi:hypothetical protein